MASKREKNGKGSRTLYKLFVTAIFLLAVVFTLKNAPNYVRNDIKGTNVVINNSNVTKSLKADVFVEDDVVYMSKEDVENFFDGHIYYDSKYDQIITTSETKVAALPINNKQITVNGATLNIYASAIKRDDKYYLPFSEISKMVYNVETTYVKNTDIVILTSLDRELIYANSTKNNSVKYKPTVFSKTVDKIERGDNVTVVTTEETENGWTRITTENGKTGYVQTKTLANHQKIRENFELAKQIDGKVSLVWDYFSEYVTAPQRTGTIEGVNVVSPTFITLKKLGKGDIEENIGTNGVNYIKWAHNNGYKVWAMVSNNSMKETTSEIINDYNLRQKFINNIINVVIEYDLDGINLDFENIYQKDKDAYSRLVIELAPRLKDLGKVLSVDVTAPDGSEDWSLCFDRNVIGKVADYIVFMAYDQHGVSSSAGTVAGYDWVETNIKKFINQEEVEPEKIILGMPFYTRIWEENGESSAIAMKDTYSKIPSSAQITWLEDVKQNYAEYVKNNKTYKVWIEDVKSITEKLNLVDTYKLAGAAYWEKDREDESVWGVISEKLGIK